MCPAAPCSASTCATSLPTTAQLFFNLPTSLQQIRLKKQIKVSLQPVGSCLLIPASLALTTLKLFFLALEQRCTE
jgi:hypothetical protein